MFTRVASEWMCRASPTHLIAAKLWTRRASFRPDSGRLHIAIVVHWLLAPHGDPTTTHEAQRTVNEDNTTTTRSCRTHPGLSASTHSRAVPEMQRAGAGATLRSGAAGALQRVVAASERPKARISLLRSLDAHPLH